MIKNEITLRRSREGISMTPGSCCATSIVARGYCHYGILVLDLGHAGNVENTDRLKVLPDFIMLSVLISYRLLRDLGFRLRRDYVLASLS